MANQTLDENIDFMPALEQARGNEQRLAVPLPLPPAWARERRYGGKGIAGRGRMYPPIAYSAGTAVAARRDATEKAHALTMIVHQISVTKYSP